jgi:hypothetical protein
MYCVATSSVQKLNSSRDLVILTYPRDTRTVKSSVTFKQKPLKNPHSLRKECTYSVCTLGTLEQWVRVGLDHVFMCRKTTRLPRVSTSRMAAAMTVSEYRGPSCGVSRPHSDTTQIANSMSILDT